jgi:carbon starvation protein CstA
MDGVKCFAHYRPAVATCPSCGRGQCAECTQHSRERRCVECSERERGFAEHVQMQRDARLALRRAGVSVPRQHGDPVFLRAGGHPLVAGLLLVLCIAVALGLGAAAAMAEQRWGVPRAAIAPALGIVIGTVVTALLGGTSRIAGIGAALVAALAVVSGPDALGALTTVTLPGPGEATAWMETHRAVALGLDALALPLAYLAAAGRRL